MLIKCILSSGKIAITIKCFQLTESEISISPITPGFDDVHWISLNLPICWLEVSKKKINTLWDPHVGKGKDSFIQNLDAY